ncbi:hypothetical protein TrCOL_g1442 [Triparma columacea]|uniref:Uncharacterized protein n=1 Tax=Triparma columacea TaxID=722753 RepID=A0A9W7GK31_9STRA|nr:hypothetical protein TrCOL_g1442 [Triparma columacea]
MVESFAFPSASFDDTQLPNLIITKYVLPIVVFTQYWQQLSYPSTILAQHRTKLKLLFGATSIGMFFQFGCTDIVTAKFPTPHDTLRWGGVENETSHVLIVVAITTAFYWLLMDGWRVRLAHTVTFWSVVTTLYVTEGTLALGSKWCTYCLIFSFVYLTDPLWNVPEKVEKAEKAESGKEVLLKPLLR